MRRLREIAEAATVADPDDWNSRLEFAETFDPPTVLALLDVARIAARIDEIVTEGGRVHPDGTTHLALGQALDNLREVSDAR